MYSHVCITNKNLTKNKTLMLNCSCGNAAASLPLLFIDGPKFHHLKFWYALFPGVAGCLVLCLIVSFTLWSWKHFITNDTPWFVFNRSFDCNFGSKKWCVTWKTMLSSKQSYGAYNFGENWFRVQKREIRSQTCVCDFFFSNEMKIW